MSFKELDMIEQEEEDVDKGKGKWGRMKTLVSSSICPELEVLEKQLKEV